MKITNATLVSKKLHPAHGKAPQRIKARTRTFTVPTESAHPVISTGEDFPCGNPFGCNRRTLRPGGRCPACSGRKLPPEQKIRKDGTPIDVVSAGRRDTPELRELRRREVGQSKAVEREARQVGRVERKRKSAEMKRQASKKAARKAA